MTELGDPAMGPASGVLCLVKVLSRNALTSNALASLTFKVPEFSYSCKMNVISPNKDVLPLKVLLHSLVIRIV